MSSCEIGATSKSTGGKLLLPEQDESDPVAVAPPTAPDRAGPDGKPQVSVHQTPPAGLPAAPLCVSTPHVRRSYTRISRVPPGPGPAASLTGADVSAAR